MKLSSVIRVASQMDSGLLAQVRKCAQRRGQTLDELMCYLVAKEINRDPGNRTQLAFSLADKSARSLMGGPMSRAEAHDRT